MVGDVWFVSWPRQTHREIPLIKLLLICLHFEASTSSHLSASLFPSFLLLYHISLRQPGVRVTYPCWHRPGQAARLLSRLRGWDSHITKLLGTAKQLRHNRHLSKTAQTTLNSAAGSSTRAYLACQQGFSGCQVPHRVGIHLKWAEDTMSNSACPCCY